MKKYEFTDATITLSSGNVVKQIMALVDIGDDVKAGDLGGYIESEKNLSHNGDAWVCDYAKVYGNANVCNNARVYNNAEVYDEAAIRHNARVFGNAKVFGNATVYRKAMVYGNAELYADVRVFGNAKVYGNAEVFSEALVYGDAMVYDNAAVFGEAKIYGKARVYGSVWVYDSASISGDACVMRATDYFVVSPIGSRDGEVTFYRTMTGISVNCGCFSDSLENFAASVEDTHGDDEHGQIYRLLIEVAKLRIARTEEESNE